MEPFKKITSKIVPLDRANVDTDAIIPKQFLKKIERTGFGVHLFHDWRYLDDAGQKPNPDFILNKDQLQNAQILLAQENFGCGSSREHAPWALQDWGFRVIISPSFADIFYNNTIKNGVLPVVLPQAQVDNIFQALQENPDQTMEVDLEQNTILFNGQTFTFTMDDFKRESLLKGMDDIGWTLQFEDDISSFEQRNKALAPWLWA